MTDRRSPIPLRRQMGMLVPLVIAWTAAVFLIFVIAALDPSARSDVLVHPALNGSPWYSGMLSNLAVVGWIVASTAGFMGAFVAHVGHRRAAARMQASGALVTLLIGLDQLFQFHRIVIGVDSFGGRALMIALYFVIGSAWLLLNQVEIARTRVVILGAAMSTLLMSSIVDTLGGEIVTSRALFVDGTTFLAALAWAVWFVTTATDICRSVVVSDVHREVGPGADVTPDDEIVLEPAT